MLYNIEKHSISGIELLEEFTGTASEVRKRVQEFRKRMPNETIHKRAVFERGYSFGESPKLDSARRADRVRLNGKRAAKKRKRKHLK